MTEYSMPAETRAYAIGDIHGRLDLLLIMHTLILEDAAAVNCRKVLIYLGDYVDRGRDTKGVLDCLIDKPLSGFEIVHLKGNHEDLMLQYLSGEMEGGAWLMNGGDATFRSYGLTVDYFVTEAELDAVRGDFLDALPATHLAFLNELQHCHQVGDYFFVHAGVRPGVPLAAQKPEDLMWIREDFLGSDEPFEKQIIHGHSIMPEVDVCNNRIGIDTGAFMSGKLTCAVIDGSAVRFLQT